MHRHSSTTTCSLVSFFRGELSAKPTNQELFLSRHVCTCANEACPFPNCVVLRIKLKHFASCSNAICLKCASARFCILTKSQQLPLEFIQDFTTKQTKLMQAVLDREDTGLIHERRQAFVALLVQMFEYWKLRDDMVQKQTAAISNTLLLQLTPEHRQVQREWEQVKRSRTL